MTLASPLLSVEGGVKRFGGAFALDGVQFDVRAGEIHTLLGENGAGKSTLAKVMAGAVQLSSGVLLLDGQEQQFRSPSEGMRAGVAMVYQETSLIPTMTVAQNMRLGREPLFSSQAQAATEARQALATLDFDVDPQAMVEAIGPAQRQMVEIARAVHLNARLIIFDEPTASLSPVERSKFFCLLQMLRARGTAIVFITHALEEALAMSDRITVMRDGKRITCGAANEFDREKLVRLMVGRDIAASTWPKADAGATGDPVLIVENVGAGASMKGMSFQLRAGEVVGFAGLVGSGRTDVAKAITGVTPRGRRGSGTVYLRGTPVTFRTPGEAIKAGVVYVTEDRKIDGLFPTMSVDDNIYLSSLVKRRTWRTLYSRSARSRLAELWRSRLAITSLSSGAALSVYSGGNQQKVVVAKALAQNPDVIFFDEPTRGVDVGAVPHIHAVIRSLADQGKAVVVISSYLPEVLSLSDRVLVAREGQITGEFDREEATEDRIMHAAAH